MRSHAFHVRSNLFLFRAACSLRGLLLLTVLGIGACSAALNEPNDLASRHAAVAARSDRVQVWVSTADSRLRVARQSDVPIFASAADQQNVVVIQPELRYQQMIGFGAAITDASAWVIAQSMNAAQRDALLRELFGRENDGLGLSFTRLTIGVSDFSRSQYSLDDMPQGEADPKLAHFNIAPLRESVLPVVREALTINPALKIMASPWSAPGWMKTSDSLLHGTLKFKYHAAFTAYLIKYVDAMAAEGVPIFALTLQNEPRFDTPDYPGMLLSAGARALVIGKHLGPALATRKNAPLIFDWDHNWDIEKEPLGVLADPVANHYVAAVAWHCYAGYADAQTRVHDAYPDKDAYLTECSGGEWKPLKDNSLLWLTRNVIIGSTRAWARGVLLWNLALDENRGPHIGGCDNCRGIVTVDSRDGSVTRTVDYDVLAHASRFVRPGAVRIASDGGPPKLDHVAFRNSDDGSLVLIAANAVEQTQHLVVRCAGSTFVYDMPSRSVATFVWK